MEVERILGRDCRLGTKSVTLPNTDSEILPLGIQLPAGPWGDFLTTAPLKNSGDFCALQYHIIKGGIQTC
jgi:hypothetical protein